MSTAEQQRSWHSRNPEKKAEYQKRWRERHKAHIAEYQRRYQPVYRLDKNRKGAREAVHYAVSTGKLRRESCRECGALDTQAHHHRGYEPAFWLDVMWLCWKHHGMAHRRIQREGVKRGR